MSVSLSAAPFPRHRNTWRRQDREHASQRHTPLSGGGTLSVACDVGEVRPPPRPAAAAAARCVSHARRALNAQRTGNIRAGERRTLLDTSLTGHVPRRFLPGTAWPLAPTVVAPAVPLDLNGDGKPDAVGYDTNGDGRVDSIDTNCDGHVDARIVPQESMGASLWHR